MMDCTHVRLLLWFARKPEQDLDADDLGGLQEHLALCEECGRLAQQQRRFDEILGQKIRQVDVPADLKGRIDRRLIAAARWGWKQYTATAASLFLALGMTLGWHFWPAPLLDLVEFAEIKAGTAPDKVEAWFTSHGLAFAWPHEFNSNYLDYYEIVEMQGKRVAKLSFRQRPNSAFHDVIAHVYAVPEGTFQMDDQMSHQVLVQRYAELPDFVYLITLSGGTLDPFLRRGI